MGFWAGIKHALNSTLGTSDFTSLDDIIAKQFTLIQSDDVYANLDSFSVSTTRENGALTKWYPKRLKMTRYGSGYLKGVLHRSNASETDVAFYVYKNYEIIYSWDKTWQETSNDVSFSIPINFTPHDVFSFELYLKAYGTNATTVRTFSVGSFTLNGTIAHGVFVEESV